MIRPLCWLLLLGAVLALGLDMLAPPAKRPVLAPDTMTEHQLLSQWRRQTGRQATEAERRALLADALEQNMLVEEALAQGLHRTDPVARHRLLQLAAFLDRDLDQANSEQQWQRALQLGLERSDPMVRQRLQQLLRLRVSSQPGEPTERELRALYQQRTKQLREPDRFSFEQRFFAGDDGYERALKGRSVGEPAGDPLLLGQQFSQVSGVQLRSRFGETFVAGLQQLSIDGAARQGWQGPVKSAYGWHLIRGLQRENGQVPSFESVRRRLQNEWESVSRQRQWRDYIETLWQRYWVVAAPDSAAAAAARSASDGPG